MVHSTHVRGIGWGHFTVRSCVHRALFHLNIHVVEPSVLHFRRLVYSFRHPVRDVRRNCDRAVLLPPVRGRLQMAVEVVLHVRKLESIRFLILGVLFLYEFGHRENGTFDYVLFVHEFDFVRFWYFNWNDRIYGVLRLRADDLRRRED